ncbi:MAG: TonB-dependent receptor domain-containing protein [Myxococcota bacterium]
MPIRASSLLLCCVAWLLAPAAHAQTEPAPAEPDAPAEEAPSQPVVVPPQPVTEVDAEYPLEAREEGLEAVVVLAVDVRADGTVAKATVKEPVGHGFDEAAVEAVERMRFRPATVDGEPTPVRISYTVRFDIEEEAVEPPEPEPPPERVVIRGRVRERGTRKPLAGVPVVVAGTDETVLTDAEGRFEVRGAGAGRYTLEVPLEDYEPFRMAVEVGEDEVAETELRVTRDLYADYKTVIERPRIEKEVAKRTLRAPEIQKIPGTSGDAIKVIQTLPGVARGAFGSGPPIIRGSSPEDTRTVLEGQYLPQLFHFGGLYSVINTDLIETVDYWPGGFSARYGQATGGVIDVSLRDLRTDRWHGTLETNVFHTGALVEGPVGEDTAVAVAARRSYIDVILPAVLPDEGLSLTVAPRYYDYQARVTHQLRDDSRVSIFGYGSDDEVVFVLDEPQGSGGVIGGRVRSKTRFHLLTGTWERQIDDVGLRTEWSAGFQGIGFDTGGGFRLDIEAWPINLRQEVTWDAAESFLLTMGAEGGVWPFEVDFRGSAPPKEGEVAAQPDPTNFITSESQGTLRFVAPYLEGTLRVADALTLVPGLRVEAYALEDSSYVAVDPRLSTRWDVAEDTVLKGFAGLYHKPPEVDEWDERLGNPDLGPERAWQVSLGVEQRLTEKLSADLQVFYKSMDDLVVPADPLTEGVRYTNDGVGRVYGMELLLRHDLSERFFGWVSYTLMRARRRDGPDERWRAFDTDQTHILTALGVFRLGRGWEAGFRFRYTSGNPETPIVGATFDADNDTFWPIAGRVNSDRSPAFHQLDIRFDKRWVFDAWMLNLYLEIQNLYNRANHEGWNYAYDYSDRESISGLPIIPNFGLEAEF